MSANRPLPDVDDPATTRFWSGLRDGEIVLQHCEHCGYVRWPVGPRCPECLTLGGVWRAIRPTGTIWSFAVYHRAFHPAFKDDVPYAVAAVELDDGPFMLARLTTQDAVIPGVGERVTATFDEVAPGVCLLGWKPTNHNQKEPHE